MTDVFIGIGSNIDASKNIQRAIDMLRKTFPDIQFSSTYKTAARDFEDQEDFLNAVAFVKTDMDPHDILRSLQNIEHVLGKATPFKFGPRTLDLDLLLYNDQIIQDPQLIVPHPRMYQRRFVLEPLCELISSTKKHPVLQRSWKELLSNTLDQECQKLEWKSTSPTGGG
ncbi:2-amino-4-hydroxy-6-hydroxymethyldihydropteridine diphosphokinase [Candidatus Peregrinibacteria bacterium]|nr:2-amino-4-hydroxy-6-hydroxymethyldihydropteridine diphosphokinase [Candidatus Peregrinibacteria bacterium]